ncbi:MAG: hypothetical protein FJW40_06105 [Acidobacteria bacterium]|nr:hypothetical protein [Acidobacteriota bacterium]
MISRATRSAIAAPLCITLFLSGCRSTNTAPALTSQAEALLPHQIPGRDLRRNPPAVQTAEMEFLTSPAGGNNARLTVRFGPGEGVPAQFQTNLEDKLVTLRDDGQQGDEKGGDGIHTALIQANLDDFRKGLAANREFPVFQGREKLRDTLRERIDLRAGVKFGLVDVGAAVTADPAVSLMVRNTGVVEDPARTTNPCTGAGTPMGKWTFGYLMQQIANQPATGISGSVLAKRWMNKFAVSQTVNDFVAPARPGVGSQILANWQAASGVGNDLDLGKAPFRLLAIVNRVDLRENAVYGGGNAGELRFVFGALSSSCAPLQFTVIFEFGVDKRSCQAIRGWAQQWANLPAPVGSAAYNTALEQLTEQVVQAGASPSKPNGSALNQLRTNEFVLAPQWELREFRIFSTDSDAGHLRMVTIKQTPDGSLRTPVNVPVRDYVNANAAVIKIDKHTVPLDFPAGTPFLGAATRYPPGAIWNPAGIADRPARHHFSLNTCDGCHAGETQTAFTHVTPAPFGTEAGLSGFMTGITVNDPADGMPSRTFNDLQRRKLDLEGLAGSSCLMEIIRPRLTAIH